MSTSLLDAGLLGVRVPTFRSAPEAVTSAGAEAVELADAAGLRLDGWQRDVLAGALGERPDGRWAAFEVGVVVPRQNGKGAILEARELAGLFLFGEELILHSAHEFKTAQEAFRRVLGLVEGCRDLERQVVRVRTSHGEEGIEVRGGRRLRFIARSTGSGRGFSGDTVILDEAYNLSPEAMAALLPTLSARANPQIWYTSSAPLVTSVVLRKLCQRGRGGGGSLAYFEWCADRGAASDDPDGWAQANPALGIRIPAEFVANEQQALEDMEFRRERLGVWHDKEFESVIDLDLWADLSDPVSKLANPVVFAVDVTPERSAASIAVAGSRPDDLAHVEVVDSRAGVSWVVDRMVELRDRWRPAGVMLDPAGPAGSLLPDLADAGVEVTPAGAREMAQACGLFYDAVADRLVRHLNQPDLNRALTAAQKRPLGDAWAWDRKHSDADISPLVAVTLALWGSRKKFDGVVALDGDLGV